MLVFPGFGCSGEDVKDDIYVVLRHRQLQLEGHKDSVILYNYNLCENKVGCRVQGGEMFGVL